MHFNKYNTPNLDIKSISLRSLVLKALVGGGRGHIGSSLSLIEIIRVIYDDFLKFDSKNPFWEERDRFILSKGHGCLALYAVLCDKGFFAASELDKFCHNDGILGGHPERGEVPGVEASTGALGHGLSIGVGVALAAKIKKQDYRTVVVTGDGEINKGSSSSYNSSAPAKHVKTCRKCQRTSPMSARRPNCGVWGNSMPNRLEFNGFNIQYTYHSGGRPIKPRLTFVVDFHPAHGFYARHFLAPNSAARRLARLIPISC